MLRRKMIKGPVPVTCSECKKKNAYHTAHGGYVCGAGRTICNECYTKLVEEEKARISLEEQEPSLADLGTWMRV